MVLRDYPPGFAYFEWLLSQVARYVDPNMLAVEALGYDSWQTIYFQRTTVILTEMLLVYSLDRYDILLEIVEKAFIRSSYVKSSPQSARQQCYAAALSIMLSPALLIIDHIHFQYNGFLYGILVLSLSAARKESTLILGGLLFAALLCLKHIYLYLAPAYFVYLLRIYCLSPHSMLRVRFGNAIALAFGLLFLFGSMFGPFIYWGQLEQLLTRLFPFARGLCHAYWAPNIWSIYSFTDRLLLLVAPRLGFAVDHSAAQSVTRGLVGDSSFSCLPNVSPKMTFILTLASQVPSLVRLFFQPSWERFVGAITLCGYSSFLFGWHVHEKAILLVIVPFSLLALRDRRYLGAFRPLAVAGHVSLFPLLFTAGEFPVKTVLFKRKPVVLLSRPANVSDEQEVWVVEQTGEVFTTYESYLQRVDFYRQKRFHCEITGHTGLSFFDALQSEVSISPLLSLSPVNGCLHLFYAMVFKNEYYPGETVIVKFEDGGRAPAVLREKSKYPELLRPDGTVERAAFSRYCVSFVNRPDEEAVVHAPHLTRERKTFTKQRLRSFLKKTIEHEAWTGAPWCVKSLIAEEYRITKDIPPHLTYENQMLQRKANLAAKKNDFEGQIVNFHPELHPLKPKGSKGKRSAQDAALLNEAYQRALAADPGFSKIPQAIQQQHIEQLLKTSGGLVHRNGFQPIATKAQSKPPPPPPPPKYPIEDLELTPMRDRATRPALKFLSIDVPKPHSASEEPSHGILMRSVGPLLETWDTLNVYCEVFQLDSFTFDDYVEALQLTDDTYHCQLLVEIHCAVLKKLVNDVNDKNGQVQVSLPESNLPGNDHNSLADDSVLPSPTPEPEVKPAARTTRSSLAKSEVTELKNGLKNGQLSVREAKIHRAAEMEQSTRSYDWKTRLRKRDFRDGRWVYIIVGLLYQLSGDARRRKSCDDILRQLAPINQEAREETTISQYSLLDINTRVKILEILCMLSLETKAIRNYMEDCNNNMTDFRKERIDMQRKRKAAVEDLRLLHEERKTLQPESKTASPIPELEELDDSRMNGATSTSSSVEVEDQDAVMDTEDEAPHQGRSLRRANDRAAQRQKRLEEEKLRKERAQAEKAKKPSKQEKQYEKVLKKIEEAKEQIREYEEEILVIENDLREADCPRTRVLGKDRFWNRYYWFERNAMPYAGLPDSSTAFAGFANGCLWVQGPDDMERQGFIELCDAENAQYYKAFMMTVPERKMIEEGETHCFNARQWGYYDDPDDLDKLIGWLDSHGVRETKLRKELQAQQDKISTYMVARKSFLQSSEEKKIENRETTTRISTRTKTYHDPAGSCRCFAWTNLTAERENGHIHSEPKPPAINRKQGKAAKKAVEEEGRQTRATNRQGKPLTRQGNRYTF
ncbi:MAG: hypothetical protein Q9177_002061 [Variospora cf. flavescens]